MEFVGGVIQNAAKEKDGVGSWGDIDENVTLECTDWPVTTKKIRQASHADSPNPLKPISYTLTQTVSVYLFIKITGPVVQLFVAR